MLSSALFSPCYKYRYVLSRVWSQEGDLVQFIGLNPSMANGSHNDPTIRKAIQMAQNWGFGGLIMNNLFAYRTPYPDALKLVSSPVGKENDQFIRQGNQIAQQTVLMWGNHGNWKNRDRVVLSQIKNVYCIKRNKNGSPSHILYLPIQSYLLPYD